MLVEPSLESTREPRLVHYLQVSTCCLDGISAIEATAENLPKALHCFLSDWQDLMFSQLELTLLQNQGTGFSRLEAHASPSHDPLQPLEDPLCSWCSCCGHFEVVNEHSGKLFGC